MYRLEVGVRVEGDTDLATGDLERDVDSAEMPQNLEVFFALSLDRVP